MTPGDRVQIIGGEHFARVGVMTSRKVVRGNDCVTVRLDKALANGDRVVTVYEEHVIPEYQGKVEGWA